MHAEMAVLNWPRSKSSALDAHLVEDAVESFETGSRPAGFSVASGSADWQSCHTTRQARLMKRLEPATASSSQSKSFSGGAMNRMESLMVSAP